uniref:leucine-rich repeat protein n=2 Tax=Candidatus Limisoma sp. TaxID=3076476 RepID=UPI004025CCBD
MAAITIPHGVSEIGSNAFYGCSSLTSIEIPEGVEYLYEQVFYGCTALESVKLPQNLLQIGNNCFYRCSSLENVTIPEGVTTIGNSAFYGCNLNALTLPSTVTSIGGSAFGNNNNLQSIICNAATPPTLGDDAFYGSNIQEVKVPLASIAAYRKAYGWKDFSNYYGGEMIADGITYRIDENGATITAAEATLAEANIPSAVEFEGNQYPVIRINDSVFYGRSQLKALTLPESLIEIGNEAFSGCGLTDLVVPEGVQTIGSHAFYRNSLENLTLPSTVTSIGGSAFGNNNNLQSIICNAATPPTLGDEAFSRGITPSIKVPLHSIASYRKAFGWKDFSNYYGGEMIADGITYRINEKEAMVAAVEPSLTEANIPSAVEFEGNRYLVIKINGYAFADNTNLTAVTLPDGLVEIGNGAFSGCKNLESVTLPESLKTFGYNAFRSCKSLKTVKIPSGVTAISSSCFRECSSLESVTIPEGVMTIEDGAFQSCNLNALALPESLEAIGSSAFNGNQSLKSVNIPAKVKTIEESAFYNCGLTDLVIQEGVQTIDNYAFNSNSLQNLTLPSTITSIGNNAFLFNSNLQSITCNAATPPTLGDNAFSSGIMPSIKVPLASIAAYKKAYGWKDFSNYYGGEEIIDGVAYRIDAKGAYVQAAIMTESEICLAENVAFEGAQYPLYKIADNAFAGNGSITLVTVPATVETIGSNAFDGVTYPIIKIKATTPPVLASKLPMLSAIVPPASVKAYKAANYWKDMTIIGEGKNDIEVTTSATVDLTEAIMTQAKITPASVTSIKVHGPLTNDDIINALNTNMRSCYAIDLSDAEIEALPDGAFNGKIGLLEITLPAGLKAIGNNAFRGCFALRNEVTIPAGVETIGSYAFAGCRNAKFNPALPETLTAIGDYAFQNCANLYAVTLPASLQTIGAHAFEASNVQEAVLPAGLKTIGAYAFRHCSNITRVTLPDGLTTLGEGAFQQCEALVTADLMNPMEITSIPRYAFDGCSGLRNVYLPFFIEAVGDYAFRGCASLRQIQFVAPTKTIGAYAFSGCRSLKSLDLFKCENFTTIGEYAFSGCTSLKSLNLPKSLETIGEYAFSGCQAISVISSPSLVPPTIASESALNGIDKDVCVLTMPKSVYLDYFRAPYWGQFVEYTASVLVGVDGQGSVMYSNNYGTAPTPVKVAAFYATAGEGEDVEEDEGDGITAEAYDSANICAKDNSTLTFRIVPDEGNEIKSVTYAGEDVTAQVIDGLFTTPVINGDTNLDVSFVASTDYIAIPVSAVSKGAEVVVPVELVNTTEVMGIECKVQIPEGFSVAKKADGSLKVEQTERKADQTLTAAVDGNVLTVKTNGTQAYTGNTGAVFTIAIAPDEATAPADYVLKVTDVKFVNATGVASRPDAKTTLTLRDYVLGDVDSDQLVAINDAVIVMNHIVGADTPAFNAKAADMDGNGSVEINDAVLIMNTVVGTESTKSIKKTSATEPNADELTAADIEICQGGTAMLSLDLANLDALTAAQFEITLPEGITAGKAVAGERASRHMIKTNMVGNVLKVAMLSAESADFEGSEGAILVLPLSADKTMPSGSYGISLRNVKMSDARGNLFILPDTDSSVVVKDWSGLDSVAFDRLRVYGGNGEICIESPADTMIQIVAVDGRAFAVEASAGKTAVAVSAGVYVVNGQKVIVK